MGDEWSTKAVCTALIGAGTVLWLLKHLAQSVLGTNGRMTMRDKHCLVTGGSSGIGKEVAKVRTAHTRQSSAMAPAGLRPGGLA